MVDEVVEWNLMQFFDELSLTTQFIMEFRLENIQVYVFNMLADQEQYRCSKYLSAGYTKQLDIKSLIYYDF